MENHDKLLKKLNNGREYRAMRLEVRTADPAAPDSKQEVEGYACTFNQPYLLYEYRGDSGTSYRIMEQIDPHAFDDCDMDDVIMQYDHEGRVFARTKNGTLALAADSAGLKVTADLGGTEIGRQLFAEIKGGYTDKMSFGFTVVLHADEYSGERVIEWNGNRYSVQRAYPALFDLQNVKELQEHFGDLKVVAEKLNDPEEAAYIMC